MFNGYEQVMDNMATYPSQVDWKMPCHWRAEGVKKRGRVHVIVEKTREGNVSPGPYQLESGAF